MSPPGGDPYGLTSGELRVRRRLNRAATIALRSRLLREKVQREVRRSRWLCARSRYLVRTAKRVASAG